jgi:hypothetical protein
LAREYGVIADRLKFDLNLAALLPELTELVQQAHDAIAKASALMRLSERQAHKEKAAQE